MVCNSPPGKDMAEVFLRQGSDDSSDDDDDEQPVDKEEVEEETFTDFVNRCRQAKSGKNEPQAGSSKI